MVILQLWGLSNNQYFIYGEMMFISKALRVFVTLYEDRNLKLAADRLCLTVPPVARMLKLIEGWLDEPLFTIERNRLIPTQAADCIYQRIQPLYCSLEQIKKKESCAELVISSPHANTLILSNLLSDCHYYFPENTSIRYATNIHTDDDLFISMQPCEMPPSFESIHSDFILELYCKQKTDYNWQKIPVLTETGWEQLAAFTHSLKNMSKHGHFGKTLRVDNPSSSKEIFSSGKGLLFRRPLKNSDDEYISLPFIMRLPLYIYVNRLKRRKLHEDILSLLKSD